MTRARAAAKANESGVKTTRILTAAARAKAAGSSSSATSGTKSTAAKRKTRADDTDGDEDDRADEARKPRGRTRTGTLTESDAPSLAASRASRARVTKKPATESTVNSTSSLAARASARKSTLTQGNSTAAASDAVTKRTTRTRSNTATKTTASAAAKTTKKAVKFNEPDKENIEPSQGSKDGEPNNIRSKPARRPQTKDTKSQSAAVKSSDESQKKPLSPRKVTQMPVSRDGPEEEPTKIPSRPTSSNGILKPESEMPERDIDSTITVNAAILNPQDFTATFGSPPRRPPSSPTKDSMKSPAKKIGTVPFPPSALKPVARETAGPSKDSISFKSTFLQTPAKRPQSPIKGLTFPSTQKQQPTQDSLKSSMFQSPAKRSMPGLKPLSERMDQSTSILCQTPAMKPIAADRRKPSERLTLEDEEQSGNGEFTKELNGDIATPKFSGRLSCVFPRSADPVVNEPMDCFDEDDELDLVQTQEFDDRNQEVPAETEGHVEVYEGNVEYDASESNLISQESSAPSTPPRQIAHMHQLREKDEDPCHDMSLLSATDEPTPSFDRNNMPTPAANNRRETMGLSALAEQLGAWDRESPVKSSKRRQPKQEQTPAKSGYFEEEMEIHDEPSLNSTDTSSMPPPPLVQEPSFEDIMVTDEDVAITKEANLMARLSESARRASAPQRSFDDNLSEASQEYGDENEMPVDPAMLGGQQPPPVTPMRRVPKVAFTTTKVPLKPADESTPSPMKKRSFSASKIPSNGTGSLPKSATVISYSPTKEKTDMWSTLGSPSRTPRKEINASLLRGAVVFVDVHTSEGADASGIFIDLLHQMGAKCVKAWNWNPSGSGNTESSSSRVGITHVVFKDGGKRTMERVRQAKGLVQCVGVSWVLE